MNESPSRLAVTFALAIAGICGFLLWSWNGPDGGGSQADPYGPSLAASDDPPPKVEALVGEDPAVDPASEHEANQPSSLRNDESAEEVASGSEVSSCKLRIRVVEGESSTPIANVFVSLSDFEEDSAGVAHTDNEGWTPIGELTTALDGIATFEVPTGRRYLAELLQFFPEDRDPAWAAAREIAVDPTCSEAELLFRRPSDPSQIRVYAVAVEAETGALLPRASYQTTHPEAQLPMTLGLTHYYGDTPAFGANYGKFELLADPHVATFVLVYHSGRCASVLPINQLSRDPGQPTKVALKKGVQLEVRGELSGSEQWLTSGEFVIPVEYTLHGDETRQSFVSFRWSGFPGFWFEKLSGEIPTGVPLACTWQNALTEEIHEFSSEPLASGGTWVLEAPET